MPTFVAVSMKFSSDISTFRKTLFFVLGLLVAAFVVSQEVLQYHCTKLALSVEQSDEADDEPNEVVHEFTCDVMLPAGTDLLKPFTPVFIREVIRESEEPNFSTEDVPLHDTRHYKTLFRQIISPNAP